MIEISSDLIEKLTKINDILKERSTISSLEVDKIRHSLSISGAVFRQMQPLGSEMIARWLDNKQIGAVDGSVNQTKGSPPHVLYLFQALAKTLQGVETKKTDVYSPLLDSPEDETEPLKWRAHILSKLELKAALDLMDQAELAILMMDGALYHYRIDAPEEWEVLRNRALERGTLLVGVSEEITTRNIGSLSPFTTMFKHQTVYDRDLLFGVLHKRESLYIESIQQKAGLRSVWMRASSSPAITGFDMLEEQAEEMNDVADFLATMTPEDGRGIPLFLDIVDREVRLSDKLVEAMVDQYLETELKERYFSQKREERPY
ncbi:DNA double-strand break repair nuclease NurA [Halalkalibacterium halodurans]|jgi:hypothetical protein|uniref:NurA domain-containing protein n=1 Tax=Halalkalibacterium halodurans TaxID=86665 RepID=A0A0M0KDE6_ALKHA|nr:DNA double-strand break repair nuclease NurA [Halalkalibacterium halodurans]MDY7220553.1 DNA double-strand break repair nuclease NurA [Halalkalibacterium halodurans]MDY7239792.1 DNA double-strand break repair nuclease NurA [Halalkalibacterium halodurans]TPE68525.1 DNA double-strand break repair nuclease NurA [Halalkalibacterium halodurans]